MTDKWNNDDWSDLDTEIESQWDDPSSDTFDDEGYQAQVKAELIMRLREFMAFSTKEDLDALIEAYI